MPDKIKLVIFFLYIFLQDIWFNFYISLVAYVSNNDCDYFCISFVAYMSCYDFDYGNMHISWGYIYVMNCLLKFICFCFSYCIVFMNQIPLLLLHELLLVASFASTPCNALWLCSLMLLSNFLCIQMCYQFRLLYLHQTSMNV